MSSIDFECQPIFGCCVKQSDSVDSFNCAKCKNVFHKNCISCQDTSNFVCGLCTIGCAGIKWAAGDITNTCPLDSTMQLILLHCIDSSVFEQKVTKNIYKDENISKVLQSTLQYGKLQDWSSIQVSLQNEVSNFDISFKLKFSFCRSYGINLTTQQLRTTCKALLIALFGSTCGMEVFLFRLKIVLTVIAQDTVAKLSSNMN